MEEIVRQVLGIARGMWTYRWPAVIAAWVVGIVATVAVFRIPDQYEASARVYVDTQSILKPLMSGLTVQPNVEQQIQMLSRTLISRPNIEKLVRMADLDLKTEGRVEQEELIDNLTKGIQIRNTGRDNLYSLVYRDDSGEKAKRVIQSLVSIFVESSLGDSRKNTDSAKTFINEQIKQYEAKLEEAEARLKEFKLRNLDSEMADGKDAAGRIAELSNQLQQAQLQLREVEQGRAALKARLADELKNPGSTESGAGSATPELDTRIREQKSHLDQLLQRFTEQHPEVVITRRQIAELEEQRKKELAEMATAAGSSTGAGSSSPVVQEINRMLASADVQSAALKARVAEYQGRLDTARKSLRTAPQIEAEAAQLNRDYDVIKKNYQDLVARRQSAIMSGELEVASGLADFRLIDPPRATPQPVAPNRVLLLVGALAAALGAAAAVAFAASQLRPVFASGADLRAKTGLPLLGVISMVVGNDQRRRERRNLWQFAGASGALVGLFAVGMALTALLAQRAAG